MKKVLQKEIETSGKLRAMTGSQGWKIVEEYLDKEYDHAMNNLLSAKTEREIFYNQAVVVVIKGLLEKIGVSHVLAMTAREKLKKYEEN